MLKMGDAARLTGVGRKTLVRWALAGKFPMFAVISGRYYFGRGEVIEWVRRLFPSWKIPARLFRRRLGKYKRLSRRKVGDIESV